LPEEKFPSGFFFLKSGERLSFDELLRVPQLFTDLGVSQFRLPGGVPFLGVDLSGFMGDLSTLYKVVDIALPASGVFLKQCSAELHACGLTRIPVGLASFVPGRFRLVSGGSGGLVSVLVGLVAALSVGFWFLKVFAVVL
jgi:Molybdenum cofactor biosynthesis enzyme